MSPLVSRFILIMLIARAIVAPVALRPRQADHAVLGRFELRFLAPDRDMPPPASLDPQYTPHADDGELVFRICYWPAPKRRAATSDLLRRTAKLGTTACCSEVLRPDGETRLPSTLPGVAPTLSTDRYLRHALGQQRC